MKMNTIIQLKQFLIGCLIAYNLYIDFHFLTIVLGIIFLLGMFILLKHQELKYKKDDYLTSSLVVLWVWLIVRMYK